MFVIPVASEQERCSPDQSWVINLFVKSAGIYDDEYLADLDEAWADFDEIVKEANGDPRTTSLLSAARKRLAGKKNTLRNLRLAAGLSQDQLAERIGAAQGYVSRMETGKERNPTFDRIKQLAEGMGVTTTDILEALDE